MLGKINFKVGCVNQIKIKEKAKSQYQKLAMKLDLSKKLAI